MSTIAEEIVKGQARQLLLNSKLTSKGAITSSTETMDIAIPKIDKLYGINDTIPMNEASFINGYETATGRSIAIPDIIQRGLILADTGASLVLFANTPVANFRKFDYSYNLIQTTNITGRTSVTRMFANTDYIFICDNASIEIRNVSDFAVVKTQALNSNASRGWKFRGNKIYGVWGTSLAACVLWIFDCATLTLTTKNINTISSFTTGYVNSIDVSPDGLYMYCATTTYAYRVLISTWTVANTYTGNTAFTNVVYVNTGSSTRAVFFRAASPYTYNLDATALTIIGSAFTNSVSGMGNSVVLDSVGSAVYNITGGYWKADITVTGTWSTNSAVSGGQVSVDRLSYFARYYGSYLISKHTTNNLAFIDGALASQMTLFQGYGNWRHIRLVTDRAFTKQYLIDLDAETVEVIPEPQATIPSGTFLGMTDSYLVFYETVGMSTPVQGYYYLRVTVKKYDIRTKALLGSPYVVDLTYEDPYDPEEPIPYYDQNAYLTMGHNTEEITILYNTSDWDRYPQLELINLTTMTRNGAPMTIYGYTFYSVAESRLSSIFGSRHLTICDGSYYYDIYGIESSWPSTNQSYYYADYSADPKIVVNDYEIYFAVEDNYNYVSATFIGGGTKTFRVNQGIGKFFTTSNGTMHSTADYDLKVAQSVGNVFVTPTKTVTFNGSSYVFTFYDVNFDKLKIVKLREVTP